MLFAKRLISDSALPMTTVANAAGYASLRRFNAAFSAAYGMAPREVRRRRMTNSLAGADAHELRLPFRPPFDVRAVFEFYTKRAIPGLEVAGPDEYRRVFAFEGEPGLLRVAPLRDENALLLSVRHARPAALLEVATRVRRMFDLDADVATIHAQLARDAVLRPLLKRFPGIRVPGGWDGFELAVRAVLGQQVTVAAARTLAARVVTRHGSRIAAADHEFEVLFPSPEKLADADLDGLGLTRARADAVRTVARAWRDGAVDCRPEQSLEQFVARWTELPGIGPWTAQYLALRALGHPDAFPAGDIVLRKAVQPGVTLSESALEKISQAWRPWRAYAVLLLWRATM